MEIAELKSVADAYWRAQKRADERRAVLHEAIRAAAASGAKQFQIVEATGYKRDNVRKIVNPELRKPKSERAPSE